MKRISVALLFVIVAALLVVLAQTPSTTPKSAIGKAPWERGDQFLYRVFLAQVTRISEQADEAERLGLNSQYLRSYYINTAQLNASEAVLLSEVASDLASQLAQYDANARELRTRWHVLVQRKRLNHEPISPVPKELRELQAGRDALILRARDRLRLSLGEAEFNRLDSWVRANAPWKQPGTAPTNTQTGAAQNTRPPISDSSLYVPLFRSVAYFKAKADEETSLGLPELADNLRTVIQRRAGLTDEQARVLDEVATQYLQTRTAYAAQLEAAKLPYNKLALEMLAHDGKITPTPELAAAQIPMNLIRKQMDALAASAIQRLRSELGDEGFGRLDSFAKRKLKAQPGTPVAWATVPQEVTQ